MIPESASRTATAQIKDLRRGTVDAENALQAFTVKHTLLSNALGNIAKQRLYGILFGTSYPVRPVWLPERAGSVRNMDITESEKELILHCNAERLYNISQRAGWPKVNRCADRGLARGITTTTKV